jgi:pimeloyl-ACP methyl ester carboxylesterase
MIRFERHMEMRKILHSILFVVLACAGASFVWMGLIYRGDIRAARSRIAEGSAVASTQCGAIEYADVGSGPPILAVHGTGGGFDAAMDLGRPFLNEGFRIVAPSRFGYLRTPLPRDASPAAQADAFTCLLDVLKIKRISVIAASAGAMSAMQFALRNPDRCSALILISPAAYSPPPAGLTRKGPPPLVLFLMKTTLRSDFLFWIVTRMPREFQFRSFLGTPPRDVPGASTEEQIAALQTVQHLLPISQRSKGMWNDSNLATSIPRYDLEQNSVPTLLISAEDDLYGAFPNAEYTAEYMPHAQLVRFATGGHILLGHDRQLHAKIVEFFRGQE